MITYPKTLSSTDLKFDRFTKLYVASKDAKISGKEQLITYILARYGVLATNFRYLNRDSLLISATYGSHSSLERLVNDDHPFKIARVFKSTNKRIKEYRPNAFLHRCALNFLNALRESLLESHPLDHPVLSAVIQVDCDYPPYRKIFMDICFAELDANPEKYKGFDFSPNGNYVFSIRRLVKGPDESSIVTWANGPCWTNP